LKACRQLGDAELCHLSALRAVEALELVSVPRLTDESLASLKASLPRLRAASVVRHGRDLARLMEPHRRPVWRPQVRTVVV
jgi:hypothetical protein